MVLAKLEPASLAPCTKSITTFNKGAENLGPREAYNENPFLPDPTQSTKTSPYMLMKGGKRRRRRSTKKMMKRKSRSKKRHTKKHMKGGMIQPRLVNIKGGRKSRGKKRHTKKHMKGGRASLAMRWLKGGAMLPVVRNSLPVGGQPTQTGGGHGGPPYGLPQGLVNMGREIEYGIKSLYESAVGGNTPVNPDPSIQPIGKSGSRNYLPALVDPEDAIKYAQKKVAKL